MIEETSKQEMLKVRMDTLTLELLEQARNYLGLDKSKFIRQSIREKAQAVIAAHEKTHFSTEDWQMFFSRLDNPPPPTEQMQKAAVLYETIMAHDEV